MTKPHNDFDVAKSIHDLLEPLNDDRRQRILRWVSESLGISTSLQSVEMPSKKTHSVPPTVDIDSQQSDAALTDIKSFVESKAPKSDVQFSAVVAYYYRFEAPSEIKTETIDSDLLQEATRMTGRKRLSNATSTLNNAKRLGYLDSSSKGEFKLNTVGENLVAMTLPSTAIETKPRHKSPKKKKVKKTTKKSGSKKSQ